MVESSIASPLDVVLAIQIMYNHKEKGNEEDARWHPWRKCTE